MLFRDMTRLRRIQQTFGKCFAQHFEPLPDTSENIFNSFKSKWTWDCCLQEYFGTDGSHFWQFFGWFCVVFGCFCRLNCILVDLHPLFFISDGNTHQILTDDVYSQLLPPGMSMLQLIKEPVYECFRALFCACIDPWSICACVISPWSCTGQLTHAQICYMSHRRSS